MKNRPLSQHLVGHQALPSGSAGSGSSPAHLHARILPHTRHQRVEVFEAPLVTHKHHLLRASPAARRWEGGQLLLVRGVDALPVAPERAVLVRARDRVLLVDHAESRVPHAAHHGAQEAALWASGDELRQVCAPTEDVVGEGALLCLSVPRRLEPMPRVVRVEEQIRGAVPQRDREVRHNTQSRRRRRRRPSVPHAPPDDSLVGARVEGERTTRGGRSFGDVSVGRSARLGRPRRR